MLLLALTLIGCQEYTVGKTDPQVEDPPPVCEFPFPEPGYSPVYPLCVVVEEPPGGFRPTVEWAAGPGQGCRGLPAVIDLDDDGKPEVIANFTGPLPLGKGDLVVLEGDGSGTRWRVQADLGFGAAIAAGDIDHDGDIEIVSVRTIRMGTFGVNSAFTAVAFDHEGNELWESEVFGKLDFDWAAAPVLSDMDHDGQVEIVVGRVILRADGTTRGVGTKGRGSYGVPPIGSELSEAAIPAVADLDLDGVEEVITGNSRYDADGNTLMYLRGQEDGMVALGNFDDDPEGEVVASSGSTVRLQDTDGRVIWGPIELREANILSVPAVYDLDGDGWPEIVVAGGNQLVALRRDGSEMWSVDVTDSTGATGASIFDFEGDGIPEVVYIDEIQMLAVDGLTGRQRFYSDEHASDTMFDYPVIADVDADEHAEIVVCHVRPGAALSVYGDEDNSWRPARRIWNQHAYAMTNVGDDGSIPQTAPAPWLEHNTWHAALAPLAPSDDIFEDPVDFGAQFLGHCDQSCFGDVVEVYGRLVNSSENTVPEGTVTLALYAILDGQRALVGTALNSAELPRGSTGGDVTFFVPIDVAIDAEGFELVADDLGSGIGAFAECQEYNNTAVLEGSLCLEEDR